MATRAAIKIEGVKFAKVYKHYDGYPSATLKWLEDFNKDFHENRGNDPEYKFAQLLRNSAIAAKEYQLDESKYTGWGVVGYSEDLSEEFEYKLMKDGTVEYIKVI